MPFGALAVALAVARTLAGTTPHLAEHVEVRALNPAAIATRSAAASRLSEAVLRAVGPDPARRLALALNAAGAPDGLIVGTRDGLPVASTDGDIAVNADPFSVERTGAGVVAVEMFDAAPARQWTLMASPGFWTTARADPSFPSARRQSRSPHVRLAGPIGPLAAAITGTYTSASSQAVFVSGRGVADAFAAAPASRTTDWQWSARVGRRDGRFTAGVDRRLLRADHAGIDARTGPDAARAIDSRHTLADARWRGSRTGWDWRVSLSASAVSQNVTAADARGVVWAGRLVEGGPEAIADRVRANDARMHVVTESRGRWLAGVSVDAGRRVSERRWNSGGVDLGTDAATGGARMTFPATTVARANAVAASAFGQHVMAGTDRLWLRAGGRVDVESDRAPMWSPRLSAGVAVAGFLVGGNLGVFADRAELDVRSETALRDSTVRHLTRLADGASLPLVSVGTPGRRRDVVARLAVARDLGRAVVTVEQTATRGLGLSGTTRVKDDGRLADAVDADRTLRRIESRARLDAGGRRWQLTLHGARITAVDDTEGAFALAALDARGERGPATGVPAWSAGAVFAGHVRQVQVVATAAFAAGLPYSLFDGSDPGGLLTFAGRAGGRNQQRLPGRRDLSVYLAPASPLRWRAIRVTAGLRVENLFGRLAPLDVVRDATSPLAGRAAGAASGRAVSIWLTAGK